MSNTSIETFSDAFNRTHMPSLDKMTWKDLGAVPFTQTALPSSLIKTSADPNDRIAPLS